MAHEGNQRQCVMQLRLCAASMMSTSVWTRVVSRNDLIGRAR